MNSEERLRSWNLKHRPSNFSEVLGNLEVRKSFLEWLKNWDKATKKIALLHGPPGVGKTLTVELASKELGYHLIELNASDERTRDVILDKLRAAVTSNTIFGQKNIVLLDEVDGIYERGDAGAVEAILKIVEMSKCPIVMTANDPWKAILLSLRQRAELFKFDKIHTNSIAKRLREVAEKEGLLYEPKALEELASRSKGDVRAAIQDLESLSSKTVILDHGLLEGVLGSRTKEENVFEAIRRCWYSATLEDGVSAIRDVDVDYFELLDWAYGNCLALYNSPDELSYGLSLMSRADLIKARILTKQEWKLLPYYIDLLAASIFHPPKIKRRSLILRRPERVSEKWIRISKLRSKIKLVSSISKVFHERRDTVVKQVIPVLSLVTKADLNAIFLGQEYAQRKKQQVRERGERG
ncbi:MAG: replication factor C large subunit [Thermoproteota archaeon]